jgi:hypothetical protein
MLTENSSNPHGCHPNPVRTNAIVQGRRIVFRACQGRPICTAWKATTQRRSGLRPLSLGPREKSCWTRPLHLRAGPRCSRARVGDPHPRRRHGIGSAYVAEAQHHAALMVVHESRRKTCTTARRGESAEETATFPANLLEARYATAPESAVGSRYIA